MRKRLQRYIEFQILSVTRSRKCEIKANDFFLFFDFFGFLGMSQNVEQRSEDKIVVGGLLFPCDAFLS